MKRRSLTLALVTAALGVTLCPVEIGSLSGRLAMPPPAQAAPRPQESRPAVNQTGGPKKWALLVGINKYKSEQVPELMGSINDVQDMREVLIGKFEFPPENILVLTGSQATHAAIIKAIQTQLIDKAQSGDIVVFDFSGHGSQMKDVTHTKISGLDETIVPYDSRQGNVFDISGAELHVLLVKLAAKTKNVTFILDSCHSGTLVRGARVRSIPEDTRTPTPESHDSGNTTRGVTQTDNPASPPYATIAAATSKESAFELFEDGADHGALTYFLTRQLRAAKAGATYRDVMDNVIGNVTAQYPAQHPSLEGAEADQHVFGDSSSLARSYVTASPSPHKAHQITLTVGQVQGATVGSKYEVYPPGSKKLAAPEKSLATVQILSVDAVTSEAAIVSGGNIPPASRAVQREHRYGSLRMRVFLDDTEASPTLQQAIRGALQTAKNVEIVGKPTLCHMQVRQSGNNIQTLAADATTLSPPVPVDDPNVVPRVVGQIKSWAKWFNVLSIRNAHSDIDLQFTLKGKPGARDPMAYVGRPDMGVIEGDTVDATLTNNSDRDLYVAILDLTSNGNISVVYPARPGVKEVLKRTTTLSVPFHTSVPKGRSVVTDILKVFASYDPIDLSPLTQGTIRDIGQQDAGESNPLQELLADSAGETRDVSLLNKPMGLGDWTTVQRVLVVKRHSRDVDDATAPQLKQGSYYALVIGIDHYRHDWELKTPVNDAKEVAELLTNRYGFRTQTLLDTDATRDHVIKALEQYAPPISSLTENDSLLIYFAGHGQRIVETKQAFWATVDAGSDSFSHWISATEIAEKVRVITARHVLIVSDSCYSGLLAIDRDAPVLIPDEREHMLQRLLNNKSRNILSSGSDEPVLDGGCPNHSIFACVFLDYLQEAKGPDFTTGELFLNVRRGVAGKSDQLPQYLTIRASDDQDGEFVFFPNSEPPQIPAINTALPKPSPDKMSIYDALRDYQEGYSEVYARRDIQKLKGVWPSMTRQQEREIMDGARTPGLSDVSVELRNNSITIDGDTAKVSSDQYMVHKLFNQDTPPRTDRITIVLKRSSGGWVIDRWE